MTVANPSTPAQLFHLLRRQLLRNYRKPLIIASPKGLLRSPAAASPLSDMSSSSTFEPVLDVDNSASATKVVLCSGKHYYALHDHRGAVGKKDEVALIRIEELSPFPVKRLEEVLKRYKNVQGVTWAQEEPQNQGPWSFVKDRIDMVRTNGADGGVRYSGRKGCATVAVAVGEWHKREVEDLVRDALA